MPTNMNNLVPEQEPEKLAGDLQFTEGLSCVLDLTGHSDGAALKGRS